MEYDEKYFIAIYKETEILNNKYKNEKLNKIWKGSLRRFFFGCYETILVSCVNSNNGCYFEAILVEIGER